MNHSFSHDTLAIDKIDEQVDSARQVIMALHGLQTGKALGSGTWARPVVRAHKDHVDARGIDQFGTISAG